MCASRFFLPTSCQEWLTPVHVTVAQFYDHRADLKSNAGIIPGIGLYTEWTHTHNDSYNCINTWLIEWVFIVNTCDEVSYKLYDIHFCGN